MRSFRWIIVLSVALLSILGCQRRAQILHLNSVGVVLLEQFEFHPASEKFREILEIDEQFVPAQARGRI